MLLVKACRCLANDDLSWLDQFEVISTKYQVKTICPSEVAHSYSPHSQTTESEICYTWKDIGDERKSECISKIKDTIEKPLDHESILKRNELGDP